MRGVQVGKRGGKLTGKPGHVILSPSCKALLILPVLVLWIMNLESVGVLLSENGPDTNSIVRVGIVLVQSRRLSRSLDVVQEQL
jgi:hypothetical protein